MNKLSPPTYREVEVVQNDVDEKRIRVRHVTFRFQRAERGTFDVGAALARVEGEGGWVHEAWLRAARELAAERLDSILNGHAPNRLQPPQRCGECNALVILPDRAPRLEELICGPDHVAVYEDGARALVSPGERPRMFGPDGFPLPPAG